MEKLDSWELNKILSCVNNTRALYKDAKDEHSKERFNDLTYVMDKVRKMLKELI